jgi:transposase
MASITRKKIRGGTYYYARECKRVDGKPKIVWQKYLGKAEDIISAVTQENVPVPEAKKEGLIVDLGAVAALYDLSERLGIVEIIDEHVPKRGKGPSVGTYMLVATINRCVAPCSKAQIGEWFEGTVLRRLVDVEKRQLTSQRYWDNMDRISEDAINDIEADVIKRMVKEFDLDLDRILFDATNFFTFIDTFNERSSLAQRGKGKEGRSALRIVGLALLVTADFHIPLMHHTYPGNEHDAPTFANLTDTLFERVKDLVGGTENITLVFDKGNNSRDNLDAVEASDYHFVGSLVPTQHPDLLAVDEELFESLADDGLTGVTAYRTVKEVFGHERTIVVTHNENLFVAQSKTLLREITKRQQRFREIVARLRKWREGKHKGKPPTIAGTKKKVEKLLKARHMRDLFVTKVSQRDGLPYLHYRFNSNAWEKLQSTLLGKNILFTDNDDWSNAEIVRAYRAQHHVEDAFRDMKDTHHIALRPQHHWTDQKVRVHVFTCVLALMLAGLLRRELHSKGIELSMARMLDLLSDIREMNMFFPPEKKGGPPTLRTSLSKMSSQQRRMYRALKLARFTST